MLPTSFGSIRPYVAADVPALARYADNRAIWLNLRDAFPNPYTEADAIRFLEMVAAQDPTTFFAIATAEEVVGGIGIMVNRDVHRLTAEMGYWLGEPFWGRGIVSEAVAVFSAWAFRQFGLVRIYAEPYAHNAASCRVLEKAGFELEGRLRASAIKDGKIVDQLLYSRLGPDYLSRQAGISISPVLP